MSVKKYEKMLRIVNCKEKPEKVSVLLEESFKGWYEGVRKEKKRSGTKSLGRWKSQNWSEAFWNI